MATDYYELLGVPRSADDKTIKAAYRKLAMDCHPDRHGGCTDKEAHFKSISEAYDVLKDPQKRAAYDRFGHAAFQNGMNGQGPFGGGAGGGFEGFSDIFSSIFGEFMDPRAQRASAARGSDLRYDLELTLEEAFSGVEKTIAIQALAACEACNASGSQGPVGGASACPTLRRRGQGPGPAGLLRGRADLPRLHGLGRDDRRSLSLPATARGARSSPASSTSTSRPVSTKARASASPARARRACAARPPGDLYLFVHMKRHAIFEREGTTLVAEAPISFTTAALGGCITIPGIDGEQDRAQDPGGNPVGRNDCAIAARE